MDRNIMTSWKTETKRMCDLAVPTIIVFLGLFTPQALTAAFIGRKLGVQYLDGFSLANLMSNLLAFSVLKGLFLANDTLMPQAFGAGNYKEVGLLAIRGYIVGLLFMTPIFVVLFLYMHPILLFLGQSPLPASLAAQFFRVYVLVFPFNILYVMMWKFLTAQEIMRPLMVVQLIACGMILPLTLTYFVEGYGYIGGAWALVVYNVAQAVLLLGYILVFRPHHPRTWIGLSSSWRSALSWEGVRAYLDLGVGGILSSAEWWFWEALILVVGTFGPIALSVHTIAAQVIMVVEMVTWGIANALVVRMGATMPHSASRAKQIMIWTYIAHWLLVLAIISMMWVFRFDIFSWFTRDPRVVEVADRLWWKVLLYFFLLTTVDINVDAGSPALGLQWYAAVVNGVSLFVLTTPAILVFAVWYGGGLEVTWTCLIPPYAAMNVMYFYRFIAFNWEDFSRSVREREERATLQEKHDANRDEKHAAAWEATPLV